MVLCLLGDMDCLEDLLENLIWMLNLGKIVLQKYAKVGICEDK